ncbi:TerC family protein [Risungbinella massiliensis]|uniref:TerC family protein n=1 Tax=Risungbinella massiliensis TaxID=1329796 RepID=UPI0005CB9F63|nr:TerC family protein [Risungbinella massiliensis]
MNYFTPDFLSALLSIIIIDLVLAGDNAIVIGLAAKNVPKDRQKSVIIWGTAGAIVMRIILTLIVVWLLAIPGLRLIGGILLLWIAFKLLVEEKGHDISAKNTFWSALMTIIIADTVMSLDNVLAIASAANNAEHSNQLLVIIGLLVSVPIIVWGSTIFIKLLDRFPIILYIGSAVLAYTAANMITEEKFLHAFFEENEVLRVGWIALAVIVIVVSGYLIKKRKATKKSEEKERPHE